MQPSFCHRNSQISEVLTNAHHKVYLLIAQNNLAKKSKLHKFYQTCVIDPGCAIDPLKTVRFKAAKRIFENAN
jgi:hypothetical protein